MNGTDVTNSHEPSYYEIALTNRQVVVAFIILLVCLLTSFFSGVWIGRESAARNAEKLAAHSGAPAAQEPEEGRSLEEFEFFEKPQAQGEAQAEPAPAAEAGKRAEGQDTTLLEDMGGEDEDFPPIEDEQEAAPAEVTLPSPSPSPTPPATPVQRPTAEERRRARQEQRQAQPQAQPTPPARPEDTVRPRPLPEASPRAATPAAAPRGGGGQVVIQVFSSPERDQAERIQKRLTSGGQKAFLSPVDVGGRTMYRVRIGPFATREAAQQVAEQVRKGYKLDTWVTE